tara:strand:+ start:721 stop:900 length:180 start_codon:yes stop_codon:yes gene_type:complete
MIKIGTLKNGQKYEYDSLDIIDSRIEVYFCRTCALKMYEPNKGFDYRCVSCHEKAEGWC